MPVTYTGRHVSTRNTEHPGLTDIALGLSRQPRFAGQTRFWWSVLDHSLFCDDLVQREVGEVPLRAPGPRLWRLGVLLHDAHEAITGDVPTDYKSAALAYEQDAIDRRIAQAFFPGGYGVWSAWEHEVKTIDRRALKAEAWLVGPPMTSEVAERHFGTPDAIALDSLSFYLGAPYASVPPRGWKDGDPTHHPGVVEYLRRLQELL